MKKKIVIGIFLLSIAVFFIGLGMIFKSTNIGQDIANIAVQRSGGMNTQKYLIIMESSIENYRSGGMIIALLGGLSIIFSGTGIYKEF